MGNEIAVVLLAVQYMIAFFFFGWLWRGWKEEDRRNKRERFWLIKHYYNKICK